MIRKGDLVKVHYKESSAQTSFEAEVLHTPQQTGDWWYFKVLRMGKYNIYGINPDVLDCVVKREESDE